MCGIASASTRKRLALAWVSGQPGLTSGWPCPTVAAYGAAVRTTLLSILLPLLAACSGASPTVKPDAGPPADLVLTGGVLYTMDPARPRAEAVAIRDGRIVAVGATADVSPLVGSSTRRID